MLWAMELRKLAVTPRSTVRRRAQRGIYDRALVDAILDEGMVCHVGLRRDEGTIVLPMAYGRIDDELFLHGARSAALLQAMADGIEACVCVTLLDALVLAKSAFHHSMNYRSVVLFGRARLLEAASEKLRALTAIVEHKLPGRMSECRAPTSEELAATNVLAFPIQEGSAKVRTGGPIEDPADEALEYWSGVVPISALSRGVTAARRLR